MPADIEPVIPAGSDINLEPVITSATFATDDKLELVNNTALPVNNTDQLTSSIQDDAAQVRTSAGSFTLSWTAPVNREDGTTLPLSEITSYGIYYGKSPGNYPNGTNVAYPALTQTVSNLPAGTYCVVMTTRDSDGRESSYSREITTDVQ